MRTTKAQVSKAFAAMCHVLGKEIAMAYNDVGAWRLDYAPIYGGYNVEEIMSESGGVRHPLGDQRMAAGEAWRAYWLVVRAIEVKEGY